MILKDVGDFIRERGIVSLYEVALHFQTDVTAVEAMADRWVDKGKVEKIKMDKGSCGGCMMCPSDIKIHYRWIRPQGEAVISFTLPRASFSDKK